MVAIATATQCASNNSHTDHARTDVQRTEVARGGCGSASGTRAWQEGGTIATAIIVPSWLIVLRGIAASGNARHSRSSVRILVLVRQGLTLGEGVSDQAGHDDGCNELAHGCSEMQAEMADRYR
jgi:hypothetical protein